jgi:hypothetical protein
MSEECDSGAGLPLLSYTMALNIALDGMESTNLSNQARLSLYLAITISVIIEGSLSYNKILLDM